MEIGNVKPALKPSREFPAPIHQGSGFAIFCGVYAVRSAVFNVVLFLLLNSPLCSVLKCGLQFEKCEWLTLEELPIVASFLFVDHRGLYLFI